MADDFTSTTSTTGSINPGGVAFGNIETVGDTDWFRISLVAGHVYQFDLLGQNSGGGTLADPFLRLRDSSGTPVPNAFDDDGGVGLDSRFTFNATSGGTYFLAAGSANNGTGTYSLLATDSTPAAPEITVLGNGVSIADDDTVPSAADHTDFGSATQGGAAVQRTFTVRNDGTGTLTTSNLTVPTGFTIVEGLASSIAAGNSDTFTVRLDTGSAGTKSGNIVFLNNDSNENVFVFGITGTVTAPAIPEITVLGNGVSIADDDTVPSAADHTDFGSATQGGAAVQRTFTVRNDGTGTLTTSNLTVPTGFTIVEGLASSIAAGNSDTFTVRLDTGSAGTKSGNIVFLNNDSNENVFVFGITGTVTAPAIPEITVLGNGVSIADDDTVPSAADHTDFGSATQGGAAVQRTFTVRNDGTGTLTTSNLTVPTGFTIVEGLASSIAAGNSDTFTVQLDTGSAGTKSGNIVFLNNDSNENVFVFGITGTVTTQPKSNLTVSIDNVTPTSLSSGGTLSLNYHVFNSTSVAAGNFLTSFYVSPDQVFGDANDLVPAFTEG